MIDRTPIPRDQRDPLPAFDPVPRRKPRHDGWTPARQVGFIEGLADTGSVTRAAAQVNMSTESAYVLRRQPGAEGFARAWEAALDMGVLRLKDEAFDRAMNGQLVPVIAGGKLMGYRRCRNDRLLTFVLRHYGAHPQPGSFRRAQPEPERTPAPRPATPTPTSAATTIVGAFAGFDLDDRAQDEIIAVLTAGAARARLLTEAKNPAYDPDTPFIHDRMMPFDHPDAVDPWPGPMFLPVGDADKGDQCWRMLDLPDERDAPIAPELPMAELPAPEAPPALEILTNEPESRHDSLVRFANFLDSGRPLDEWTEWRL